MPNSRYASVALSLGGNIGNVTENFKSCICGLRRSGMLQISCSSCYRTAPVDCPPGSPGFINAALTGLWPGTPASLLARCKEIESAAGRNHSRERNAPRPLDIDIILYGSETFSSDGLKIPHPEASKRLFVLVPLNEIASPWIFPDTGLSVGQCIAKFAELPEMIEILSSKTVF